MAFAISAGTATLIAGGAGLAGAAISAHSAGKAADAQSAAADRATQAQLDMYNQTRADNEPWRTAGSTAIGQMGNSDFQKDFTSADFSKDPGYDFRMQEGMKALERSAAARGGLNSGATLKSIGRYGQDYASNEYGNAYNRFNQDRDRRFGRLSNIAGMGQGANSSVGNAGMNYANNSGANMMGAANAQGAAGIASANAWGGALNGIGRNVMDQQAMSNQKNWMSQWNSNQGGGLSMAGNGYANMGELA